MRIAYLVPRAEAGPWIVGGATVDLDAYLRQVVAAHSRDEFAPAILFVGDAARPGLGTDFKDIPLATLGVAPGLATARRVAEADYDALIDLGGMAEATAPFLAAETGAHRLDVHGTAGRARRAADHARVARRSSAPRADMRSTPRTRPSAGGWAEHRRALEAALRDVAGCERVRRRRPRRLPAAAMTGLWRNAVEAHQASGLDAALAGYEAVLAEQPEFAPAHYLKGLVLRDLGRDADATSLAFGSAWRPLLLTPTRALRWRISSAGWGIWTPRSAACHRGLALAVDAHSRLALRRALGLAELARHDGAAARDAFEEVLKDLPTDAEAHYNHGVALQMMHLRDDAMRAYQRALAINPDLIAADFNIGVILQEQGRTDDAIAAFEQVIARDPRHVPAHKALGDTLLAARRIDDWLRVFERFEASCPRALSLAVQALEVYQYRGDFAGLDRYLDRLRQDDFKPENETDLADCLEQLLFLLLYFDIEPEAQLGLYRAYDAVAQRVYGKPLPTAASAAPGAPAGRISLGRSAQPGHGQDDVVGDPGIMIASGSRSSSIR